MYHFRTELQQHICFELVTIFHCNFFHKERQPIVFLYTTAPRCWLHCAVHGEWQSILICCDACSGKWNLCVVVCYFENLILSLAFKLVKVVTHWYHLGINLLIQLCKAIFLSYNLGSLYLEGHITRRKNVLKCFERRLPLLYFLRCTHKMPWCSSSVFALLVLKGINTGSVNHSFIGWGWGGRRRKWGGGEAYNWKGFSIILVGLQYKHEGW